MSAVTADSLVVRFGSLVAVDEVSLEVARGEVFGLLGPNGAGKTTTLRVLTTLLRAERARRSVAGWDVRADGLAVRASIGYMPQALSADGALTARENLDFYARVTAVPRAERPRGSPRRSRRWSSSRCWIGSPRRSRAGCCGGWRSPRRC